MRQINVHINSRGETTVEPQGYENNSCTAASEPLTKALIGQNANRQLKPEATVDPSPLQESVQVRE